MLMKYFCFSPTVPRDIDFWNQILTAVIIGVLWRNYKEKGSFFHINPKRMGVLLEVWQTPREQLELKCCLIE